MEFKVCSKNSVDLISGLLETTCQHWPVFVFPFIFGPSFWLITFFDSSKKPITFFEFICSSAMISIFILYCLASMALIVFRALRYEIPMWVRFGDSEVLFFKQPGEKNWKSIPYEHFHSIRIASDGRIFLTYWHNGVGRLGLPSAISLGKKEIGDRERIMELLRGKCPKVNQIILSNRGNHFLYKAD